MINYPFLFQNYLVALFLIAPILGYGFLVLKLLKSSEILKTPILNIFIAGLLGLCALSVIAIALNFILPVSNIVSLSVLFIGFLLFIAYLKQVEIKVNLKTISLFLAIFFFTFTISQIGYPNFGQDTAGYHIQCVKWFEESTAPIGVAGLNLHFALNNAIFALGAIFDIGYFKNTSIFITNGFFVFFWLIGIVYSLTTKKQLSSLYLALTIIIFALGTYKFLGNLYSELSTAVISIALIYLLILYYEKKQDDIFKIIVVFAMFGAILKLSMIIFGIATIIVASILNPSAIKRNFFSSLIISLIIISPWVCRNIYMSGMLIFPISATALPLEWSIDSQTCRDFAKYVMDWARYGHGGSPSSPFIGFEWVVPWIKQVMFRDLDINRSLAIFGVSIIAIVYQKKRLSKAHILLFAPMVIGILYWFFTAPDPRFAYALINSVALLLLCFAIIDINLCFSKYIYFAIAIGLSIVLYSDNLKKIDEMPKDVKWPDIRHYQGTFLTTDNNITYFMPNPKTNCTDAPLPCLKPTDIFIKYNQEFFTK